MTAIFETIDHHLKDFVTLFFLFLTFVLFFFFTMYEIFPLKSFELYQLPLYCIGLEIIFLRMIKAESKKKQGGPRE
jgi:hypothetical protein